MFSHSYCTELRTVPKSKIELYRQDILKSCDKCKNEHMAACDVCLIKNKLFDRYIEANIPMIFIDKTIENFYGDQKLIRLYNNSITNLHNLFKNGTSFCIKGQHGVGKTMFSCLLLKKVVERGIRGLYTTLFDIVNVIVYASPSIKFEASKELKNIDYLVIDEFDSRFTGSQESSELFGRILETIIRIRFQNILPTILITNSLDPVKNLGEKLSESIGSLITGHCSVISVVGEDYRKKIKAERS